MSLELALFLFIGGAFAMAGLLAYVLGRIADWAAEPEIKEIRAYYDGLRAENEKRWLEYYKGECV